ncbi:subtilisin-like protein, partial [Thozetella sp. PMI_491]
MKDSFATIAGLLLALQASLGAAVSVTNSTNAASYGYIVELDPGSSFRGPLAGRDDHAEFHRLARDVAAYTVRHEFKNAEFFYGLSIDAKNNSDVAALKDLPGVKAVYPNKFHARPGPVEVSGSAASVAHIKGSSDVLSSLKMTGVDAVHELGLKGKGVKIGILDTGVDYYHPALGGGFGEGFKIAGGYDLVGDDYTGANLPVPDSDPLASCLSGGHGTHVAGIIGAQDPDGVGFGITGVAPEATLYMYRVLGCNGGVTDDVMMQGFQRAAEDGVDLISMSIGGAYIWTSGSPWIPLLDAIQKRGIGMVIAAGNDGQYGLYATSSPSYVPAAISVGSVGNTKFATLYNAADSAGNTIEYVRIVPHDPNG